MANSIRALLANRIKLFLLIFSVGLICGSAFANSAPDLYPLENKAQKVQFDYMLQSLRCLVCQNQNLEDSHAPLAKDLKSKVYTLVKDGRSDDEIMRFMTERYGDFVLFKPPVKFITYGLWFCPFLFLFLGLIIFKRTTMQRDAN